LKGNNEGSADQHGANYLPLDADTPPMDEAQRFYSESMRLLEIRFNDGFDLFGLHGVQIEDVSDRDADWFLAVLHDSLRAIRAPNVTVQLPSRLDWIVLRLVSC
jgi:hypothetical protein